MARASEKAQARAHNTPHSLSQTHASACGQLHQRAWGPGAGQIQSIPRTRCLRDELIHGSPPPGPLEGDGGALVVEHLSVPHRHRSTAEDLLCEIDHVAAVGVRLVNLDGCELGVVARGDALVAEDAAELENALEAPCGFE